MLQFHPVSLFGGAITVSLPTDFADVSSIRQVPDNQEVYLSRTGFTSIIFDLTERVEDVENDEAALMYHLKDIVDEGDGTKLWGSSLARVSTLPEDTPVYTVFATIQDQQQARQESSSQSSPKSFTAILLVLIRLASQETDVVISINVPHLEGKYIEENNVNLEGQQLGPQLEESVQMRDEILRSFEIKDWHLFDGGHEAESNMT